MKKRPHQLMLAAGASPRGNAETPTGRPERSRYGCPSNSNSTLKVRRRQGFRPLFGGSMESFKKRAPPGFRWVFCRSYVHPRTRQRVYARNGKCFAFLAKI